MKKKPIIFVIIPANVRIIVPFITALIISIFQAVTQIQEQTLVFLPKFLIVLTIVLFGGPVLINKLASLFTTIMNLISTM